MQYILTEEEYKNLKISYDFKQDYLTLVDNLTAEIKKVDDLFPKCGECCCDNCPFRKTYEFNEDLSHMKGIGGKFFGYNYSYSMGEPKCLLGRTKNFSK